MVQKVGFKDWNWCKGLKVQNRVPRKHFLLLKDVSFSHNAQRHTWSMDYGRTDGQTKKQQYHANSRSYCVAVPYDWLKNNKLGSFLFSMSTMQSLVPAGLFSARAAYVICKLQTSELFLR